MRRRVHRVGDPCGRSNDFPLLVLGDFFLPLFPPLPLLLLGFGELFFPSMLSDKSASAQLLSALACSTSSALKLLFVLLFLSTPPETVVAAARAPPWIPPSSTETESMLAIMSSSALLSAVARLSSSSWNIFVANQPQVFFLIEMSHKQVGGRSIPDTTV